MADKPLILVTNDDGIRAAGINALASALERVGEVLVVAPEREQSAVGHGISLIQPTRVTPEGKGRHAVSGTPADSVLVGLFRLCERRPDLVLSGINLGLNLGTDVFYSGTVAGALEGALHGVQSIAVSQELPGADAELGLEPLLRRTAELAADMARALLERPLPDATVLSINAPARLTRRCRWTRLGRRIYREVVDERRDLRGKPYFWIGGPVERGTNGPGLDSHAVEAGEISLTLLSLDLTAELPGWYDQWTAEGYEIEAGPGTDRGTGGR